MAYGDPTTEGQNPWDKWGEVFEDPSSLNPAEVRQYYLWVNDLRGEKHEATLEQALRDWGYLQEGESIGDLQGALQAIRENQDPDDGDPFAQMMGQAPPRQYVNVPGEEEVVEIDEQGNELDPYALREIWQQDMQRVRDEMRAEWEQEQQNMQLNQELARQLEKATSANELDDDDRQELWNRVQWRIQNGDVNPQKLNSLVDDTYKQMNDWVEKHLNARLNKKQGGTTAPPASSGNQPAQASRQPVSTFQQLARRSMERLGEGDD